MRYLPLILLIAFAGYCLPFFISDRLISPDDEVYLLFSRHLGQTGRLAYLPDGDEVFGIQGFIPRYFVYSKVPARAGQAFPRKFPGFIFFWAPFHAFLPWEAARLVNPLLATGALLLLFLIGRTVFPGGKEAILAAVFLATTPLFIHRAYMYNATLCNAVFFLLALYGLLLALGRGSGAGWLLFGLAGAGFLWMHPTNPVYLLALFFFILIERKRVRLRTFLVGLVLIAASAGGILLFNKICFGGFFSLGYTVTHTPPEKILGVKPPLSVAQVLDYLRFHPSIWLNHLKNAPLSLAVGFPLLVLSVVGFTLFPGGDKNLRFRWFYLFQFLLSVAFFANFATFGHEKGEFTLHSSFLRYLMPTVVLLPLLAARAVTAWREAPGRIAAVLVLFNLFIAVAAPSGVVETVLQSLYYRAGREFILKETPRDAVLLSHYWEKLVFPDRMVYTGGTHFPGEDVAMPIRKVLDSGVAVVTTSHPNDQAILTAVKGLGTCEEIVGPDRLGFLVRWAAKLMPSEIYPLRLYRVSGAEREKMPEVEEPFLPVIVPAPDDLEE